MRWLFLLLLVLNVFYAGWHQQEALQQPVEIRALSLYKGNQQDIRLLSETDRGAPAPTQALAPVPGARDCLYVGGYPQLEALLPLEQRLAQMGVKAQAQVINGDQGAVHWLRIDAQSQRLLDESALSGLSREFNNSKHQIMPCEGIATAE
ncbi:hypothetical protein [Pseudomonas sp. MWU16-30317]|uniref:hypothetical protein n=1 Tax=Pseudomonas sp. MWU16-30317 TaxID=2878095 RepID=UPI001CFB3ABC|nr:hypothetical protein [Pseudomonas sp. MWU16-30317]